MIICSSSNIDLIQGVSGYGTVADGATDWRIENTATGVFNILNSPNLLIPNVSIIDTGNIGIGTIPSTGTNKLQVQGDTSVSGLITVSRTTAGTNDILTMCYDSNNGIRFQQRYIGIDDVRYDLIQKVANVDKASCLTLFNGNVGIGTTNPSTELHIYDDLISETKLAIQNNFTILPTEIVVTGTTRDTIGDLDRYILFPYSGTETFKDYTFATTEPLICDILLVGGGGGGGQGGGGGGGGGVLLGVNIVLNSSSISIKVGKGGTGASINTFVNGTNGGDTSITINSVEYIAKGGGGGGTRNASNGAQNGSNGGSGGGGSTANFSPQAIGGVSNKNTYANFQSFGNNGGAGKPDQFGAAPILSGGGGGGAGGVGGDYIWGTGGGNGGTGKDFLTYFGSNVGHNGYFGGGGGGHTYNAPGMAYAGNEGYGNGGNGLFGGGGNGGLDGTTFNSSLEYPAVDGLPNTGGGGGGGKYSDGQGTAEDNNGGHGGTGVVIIRYRKPNVSITTTPSATLELIRGTSGDTNTDYKIGNYNGDFKIMSSVSSIDTNRFLLTSNGDITLSGSVNATSYLLGGSNILTRFIETSNYVLSTSNVLVKRITDEVRFGSNYTERLITGLGVLANYWTIAGANDIYLNQTGNVGVGTQTNLTNKLQVQGTMSASGLITGNNGITVSSGNLTCANDTLSKTYTATNPTAGTNDILTMRYDSNNGIRFQQTLLAINDVRYDIIQRTNNADYTTPAISIYKGNVGIGTNNPQNKLEVNQNMRINASGAVLYFGDDNTTHIYRNNTSQEIRFVTGGVDNRMIIASNGNVSIGNTTTSTHRLNVTGDVNVSGGYFVAGVAFKPATATTADKLTTPRQINGVDFDGSANITIASSKWTGTTDIYYSGGSVGIGTIPVSGANKLQVQGDASISGLITGNNGITVSSGNLTCANDTLSKTYTATNPTAGTNDILTMRYDSNNGIRFQQTLVAANDVRYDIIQRTNNADYTTPAISIYKGNVGIGTNNPNAELHITCSSTATNPDTGGTIIGLYVHNPTNTASQNSVILNRIAGTTAGKVIYAFNVNGSYGCSLSINGNDTTNRLLRFNNSSDASGTDLMVINNNNGNVSIGNVVTDTYKLNITGNVNVSGGYFVAGVAFKPATATLADSATVLATPRTIALVDFNGSTNINIPYFNLTNKITAGNGITLTTGSATTSPSISTNLTAGNGISISVAASPVIASSQWVTTGANIYYNTGNVGIGNTDTSTYKLNITGDVNISGSFRVGGNIWKPTNAGTADNVPYSGISGVPTTWTTAQIPTLEISKTSGLQSALDAKQATITSSTDISAKSLQLSPSANYTPIILTAPNSSDSCVIRFKRESGSGDAFIGLDGTGLNGNAIYYNPSLTFRNNANDELIRFFTKAADINVEHFAVGQRRFYISTGLNFLDGAGRIRLRFGMSDNEAEDAKYTMIRGHGSTPVLFYNGANDLIGYFQNNGFLWTAGGTSSDSRIKKEIEDITDESALQMILAIEPKTYKYIDDEKGTERVYGFIAQQIRSVIPEATALHTDLIPNIMKNAICDKNKVYLDLTTYDDVPLNDEDLKINITFNNGRGDNYKIVEITKDYFVVDRNIFYEIYENGVPEKVPLTEVFVKGYQVNNFHKLKKEYIFTLNVCATQILSRKIDAQSNIIQSHEERIKDLEAKIQMLLSNTT